MRELVPRIHDFLAASIEWMVPDLGLARGPRR
jgi:hypothetical protein